jgi:hypothetical protein
MPGLTISMQINTSLIQTLTIRILKLSQISYQNTKQSCVRSTKAKQSVFIFIVNLVLDSSQVLHYIVEILIMQSLPPLQLHFCVKCSTGQIFCRFRADQENRFYKSCFLECFQLRSTSSHDSLKDAVLS